MGNLPQALPKTVIAADYVRRHAVHPVIQKQATDLLETAAWAEVIIAGRGRPAVPPDLLRELVTATGALAGRRWLRANAASPAVETFTTLSRAPHATAPHATAPRSTAPHATALPALDQVLSAVLWSRFTSPRPGIGGSRKARNFMAASRLVRFRARRNRATA